MVFCFVSVLVLFFGAFFVVVIFVCLFVFIVFLICWFNYNPLVLPVALPYAILVIPVQIYSRNKQTIKIFF